MKGKKKKQRASTHTVPHEEDIRARAREIYLARIGSGVWGDPVSDWLQAERELLDVDRFKVESPILCVAK